VLPKGITKNPEKVKAVREWKIHRNEHDVATWAQNAPLSSAPFCLGLCDLCPRQSIPDSADIAKPLTKLVEEIALLVNWYNKKLLSLLWQFSLTPNRINAFMDLRS
jgi:hypothetical protein